MVHGLPQIVHASQLCDTCLTGKQRRALFPQAMSYRASKKLELIHADLCGPIILGTPGGKRYFLLMVDDLSRFTWLALLASKDELESRVSYPALHGCSGSTKRLQTPDAAH